MSFTCFDWKNFEKLTELISEIHTMDLELINLIDHDTTEFFRHKIPGVYRDSDDGEIHEDNENHYFFHNSMLEK